jgi:hypothetical protein
MDEMKVVKKYSNLPIEEITYLETIDDKFIESIRKGIVFIVAFWSGPSLVALSILTTLFNQLDFKEVDLYVVNIDGLTCEFIEKHWGNVVNGWGETFWIKNGAVVLQKN